MRTFAAAILRRLRPGLGDALLVLLVMGLAFKVVYDVAIVHDVEPMGDEIWYMTEGLTAPEHGIPPAEHGPVYCLWYFALSLLQPDRVRLYFLSWSLLVTLLPVSVYTLTRAVGGTRPVSLLAAFFVLTSSLIDVWPFVTFLATSVLALGAALASRCRPGPMAWAVLGLTLLVAGYVRPEAYVAFACFCLAGLAGALWVLRYRPQWRPSLAAAVLLVLLPALALGKWVGVPMGGGRAFFAFGQHYSLNVTHVRHLSCDPWVDWERNFRQDFGGAQTFAQALQANPRAFLWHVGVNVRTLPGALLKLVVPNLELYRIFFWGLCGVLILAVVLGGIGVCRRLAAGGPGEDRRGLLRALLLLGFVLVPTTTTILLIHPRVHHLIPIVVFGTALVGAGLTYLPWCRSFWRRLDTWPALLALGVVLLALAPNRAHGWDVQQFLWRKSWKRLPRPFPERRGPGPLVSQTVVATLRSLNLPPSCNVLEALPHGRAFLAAPQCRPLGGYLKADPFWAFVQRYNISVILVDHALTHFPGFRDDPEFKEFVSGDGTGDFTFVEAYRQPRVRIAVRKDLLPAAGGGEPSVRP
jgi:hypothetical protein